MIKGLVSIIVPIYKVNEWYLRKCIECIQNQSYQKIEIILIDDGSPDDSGKICDEIALRDDRIRVRHIENRGVSNARNVGLDISQGEYVSFVDSDDFVNKYMIEHLVSMIEEKDADCAMCSCNVVSEDKVNINELDIKKEQIHVCELLQREAVDTLVYMKRPFENFEITAVWGTIYRRDSLLDHQFDIKMAIGEDFVFKYDLFKNISRLVVSDAQYYTYILHEQSAMRNGFHRKKIEGIRTLENKIQNEDNLEYRKGLICRAVNIAFVILFMIPIEKEYCVDRMQVIEFIKRNRRSVLKNKSARTKVKVATLCSYLGFDSTQRLFQILQR